MDNIDVGELQALASARQIVWTEHIALRLRERGIKRRDVISCIQSGIIIEQYPNDMPFPSCLVLGVSVSGYPLHVVCGYNENIDCCIITAYYPSSDIWESDNKTRKVGGSI